MMSSTKNLFQSLSRNLSFSKPLQSTTLKPQSLLPKLSKPSLKLLSALSLSGGLSLFLLPSQGEGVSFQEPPLSPRIHSLTCPSDLSTLLNTDCLSDHVFILDFYADWCGPCLKVMPILTQTVQNMPSDCKVCLVKVNVDKNGDLCDLYEVRQQLL